MLSDLNTKHNIVTNLLNNLSAYCAVAQAKIAKEPALLQDDRSKMKLASAKHSHKDEIAERLAFLQFYAAQSDF